MADLQADNAKLRTEKSQWITKAQSLDDEAARLRAEVERLRTSDVEARKCHSEAMRQRDVALLQLSEYKKALEDIAGRSCCDEICIGPCSSSRAKAALGVTKKQEGVVFYCPRCGGQIRPDGGCVCTASPLSEKQDESVDNRGSTSERQHVTALPFGAPCWCGHDHRISKEA